MALLQQKAGGKLEATDMSTSRTKSSADLKQWKINPHAIRSVPAVGPFRGILSHVPQHGQEAEHDCLPHKNECRETEEVREQFGDHKLCLLATSF